MSRLNYRIRCGEGDHYDHVRRIVENTTPCALTPSEIEKASAADPEISLVKECVYTGDWSACNIPAHVKNELCSYGHLVLRGSRIVIPRVLREQVLKLEICPGLTLIRCTRISISVTKCPLALLANFNITCVSEYRQFMSQSVLQMLLFK